jgi:hypothetical protein
MTPITTNFKPDVKIETEQMEVNFIHYEENTIYKLNNKLTNNYSLFYEVQKGKANSNPT